jgi:ferredoxin-thioredoxin reductase catalytic subunit
MSEVIVSDEELLSEITARANVFAAERGYAFSRVKDRILKELVKMRQLTGEFYCPCVAENSAATICPCEEVRTGAYVEQMGKCHCNLFVKA